MNDKRPTPRDPRRPLAHFSGNPKEALNHPRNVDALLDLLSALQNLGIQYGQKPGLFLGHRISKLVLPPPPLQQTQPYFHPFKIYPVPAASCADPADAWRTFQINSGIIAFRSAHGNAMDEGHLFVHPSHQRLLGNFENWGQVILGSDGFYGVGNTQADYSFFTPHSAPATGYETAQLVNDAIYQPATWAQFVLSKEVPDEGSSLSGAAFWIEIEDQPIADGPVKVAIKAQMFGDGPGISASPFPDASPLIIPIGIVGPPLFTYHPEVPAPIIIQQYLDRHLTNRWPGSYSQGIGDSSPLFFRAIMDVDDDTTRFYYPGDLVVVLNTFVDPNIWSFYVWADTPGNSTGVPSLESTLILRVEAP